MTLIGYTMMCEQAGPKQLVRDVALAEEAGFDFAVISDHYFPWLDSQGHSPYAWSVLGAASQATERIPLMTYVTCPIRRYHPAVVAQKAATMQLLSDGRFTLGLGAGENLNEHIVGGRWPIAALRHEMLEEAVEIIRALWAGGSVTYRGKHTVAPTHDKRFPENVTMCTSYTPGVPRLGVPALLMSDSSMGIVNLDFRPGDTATALPASIVLASSFNPELARAGGRVIAREARSRGFNVQLAGGVNLARDPRNGRNFEYLGEDPLVSAVLCAELIDGIQGEGVISTIKHYSLNCNETMRHWLDVIDPVAHRESDLFAFEIAIERSQPGSVMTGYNKVNGDYAGGNGPLLNDLLKGTWGYPGWVISDWGATPEWEFALAGLDQESGVQLDAIVWRAEQYVEPLRHAYQEGRPSKDRLSAMVRRILRSMFAVGIDAWGPAPEVDMAAHHEIALETARQGIVLLTNDDILPLATDTTARIAVIGGHAQLGVPVGFGSSAVVPPGGYAERSTIGGTGPMGVLRSLNLLPSAPFDELKKLLPEAQLEFDPGMSPSEAALLARRSDVAIVFGIRVEGESFDLADLALPWGQDAVIEAVAAACPNTIVVLETGNPVDMPWREEVPAIVEAWYPGQAGGQAVAEILTGGVNPSGRLPITFPESLAQTPRPELPGLGTPWPPLDRFAGGTPVTIRCDEGAEVGHRWFAKTGETPLYAFGHGLSYTSFDYRDPAVEGGETVAATFTVTNTGDRAGADVPQLYLTEAAGAADAAARLRARRAATRRVTHRDGDRRPKAARALRRRRRPMAHHRRNAPDRTRKGLRRSRAHRRGAADGAPVRELIR